jgi:hypothetical protein
MAGGGVDMGYLLEVDGHALAVHHICVRFTWNNIGTAPMAGWILALLHHVPLASKQAGHLVHPHLLAR